MNEYYPDEKPYVIFLGDDTTDEDAFAAIQQGLSIFVGQKKNSRARFYLKHTGDVQKFIACFLNIT